MNIVGSLIEDTIERGEINGKKLHGPSVLINMNKAYQLINTELECLEKKLSIPAGTFDDETKVYDLPSDWIKPFLIVPGSTSIYGLTYIMKEDWNPTKFQNSNCYTILNDQLVFANVDENAAFDFYYYGSGLELVDEEDEDIGAPLTQTNTPEWKAMYHDILVYEILLKSGLLSKEDALILANLREKLGRSVKNNQSTEPVILGGRGPQSQHIDPDYYDGQWITRRM